MSRASQNTSVNYFTHSIVTFYLLNVFNLENCKDTNYLQWLDIGDTPCLRFFIK